MHYFQSQNLLVLAFLLAPFTTNCSPISDRTSAARSLAPRWPVEFQCIGDTPHCVMSDNGQVEGVSVTALTR